jgi:putative addiction module component (TIGR02574 family)
LEGYQLNLAQEVFTAMNSQTQAILDAALALPEVERALLVERLLETLSPEPDQRTEEELAAELDRRFAEFQQDPSVAIPWSKVKDAE